MSEIYGSGLRLSEAVNLKVSDIDGKQGRIFIRSGKGNRDRYALLSQKTLDNYSFLYPYGCFGSPSNQ